jgi:NADPH:quinone reductase-like Zn-dependent oxidoreductase
VSLVAAAGLPETVCTVWSNVFMAANLQPQETLLVHGGAGGIGTTAIQLAKALGAKVLVTVGSAEKARRCLELGADVILDNMGASYLARNVDALAVEGRLANIGLQGGRKGELDLGKLMTKRAAVLSTSLRARPASEKAAIVASVREHVWPLVNSGALRAVVDREVPMADAAEAHRVLEASEHVGKVILVAQ